MALKTRTGVAAAKTRLEFDVGTYLESAGPARKVLKYRVGQTVFSQGEPANDIRYLQKGAIKLSVLSKIEAFSKKQTIFAQGDSSDAVFYIKER